MTGAELLDKMNLIDPMYIDAAEKAAPRKRKRRIQWVAMAACFCLAVGGALATAALRRERPVVDSEVPDHTEAAIFWETELATEPFALNGALDGDLSILEGKPMVSGYGDKTLIVDMAVSDGGIWISDALQGALGHYADTANYRVIVELFSDGVQIASGGSMAVAEAQRLRDLGYIVAMEMYRESITDGDIVTINATYFFTLHATYEQLIAFSADGGYGYKLMLYDEVLGGVENGDITAYNGTIQ